MKKIKKLSFIFFLFSALTFSFPADSSAFDLEVLQSIEEHLEREQHNTEDLEGHSADFQREYAEYHYLQSFFVNRKIDRHTPIFLEAFNSCTGMDFNRKGLTHFLTPPPEEIHASIIYLEQFYDLLHPSAPNLKECLCESNIDPRIKRGGLNCMSLEQVDPDPPANSASNPANSSLAGVTRNEPTTLEELIIAYEEAIDRYNQALHESLAEAGVNMENLNIDTEELYQYLQTFFVDRRIDRHTPIVLDAFNSCTDMTFTTQNLIEALTPTPGTTIHDTLILFMAHIQVITLDVKQCLCTESNIDLRIKRGGLNCKTVNHDSLNLQQLLSEQQQELQRMSNISKMLNHTAMAVIRKID